MHRGRISPSALATVAQSQAPIAVALGPGMAAEGRVSHRLHLFGRQRPLARAREPVARTVLAALVAKPRLFDGACRRRVGRCLGRWARDPSDGAGGWFVRSEAHQKTRGRDGDQVRRATTHAGTLRPPWPDDGIAARTPREYRSGDGDLHRGPARAGSEMSRDPVGLRHYAFVAPMRWIRAADAALAQFAASDDVTVLTDVVRRWREEIDRQRVFTRVEPSPHAWAQVAEALARAGLSGVGARRAVFRDPWETLERCLRRLGRLQELNGPDVIIQNERELIPRVQGMLDLEREPAGWCTNGTGSRARTAARSSISPVSGRTSRSSRRARFRSRSGAATRSRRRSTNAPCAPPGIRPARRLRVDPSPTRLGVRLSREPRRRRSRDLVARIDSWRTRAGAAGVRRRPAQSLARRDALGPRRRSGGPLFVRVEAGTGNDWWPVALAPDHARCRSCCSRHANFTRFCPAKRPGRLVRERELRGRPYVAPAATLWRPSR